MLFRSWAGVLIGVQRSYDCLRFEILADMSGFAIVVGRSCCRSAGNRQAYGTVGFEGSLAGAGL